MTTSDPVVYTDDPDAHWTYTITSDSGTLDWSPVTVAAADGLYDIAATWLGSPATVRQLKVPLTTLEAGRYILYLKNPGANDILLGRVFVRDRI